MRVKGCIYVSCEFRCGRKLGLLRTQNPCNCLFTLKGFTFRGHALQEVQSQGRCASPRGPASAVQARHFARTTHMPTKEVVDEYAKVVGVENVAGTGIHLLECALSVNDIKGLPAIPVDVCSVRQRLQKLQHENGEPLRYLLRVNL